MARTGRNLIRSVAFKLSANAMAPPSPILLLKRIISVMVAFALWYFCDDQCWHATGWPCALLDDYKAAKPEVSTPRKPRESDSCVYAFRLPAQTAEASHLCVSYEEMCNHNMSWSAVCCIPSHTWRPRSIVLQKKPQPKC